MTFNESDKFEIKAIVFRRMTGNWPPGKDCPAAVGRSDEDLKEDLRAWHAWDAAYGEAVSRTIDAVVGYVDHAPRARPSSLTSYRD